MKSQDKEQELQQRLAELTAIYKYFYVAGEVGTQQDFADLIGAGRSTISLAMNGRESALTANLVRKAREVLRDYQEQKGIKVGSATQSQVGGIGNSLVINALPIDDQQQPQQQEGTIPTIPYKVYQETGVNLLEYIQRPDLHRTRCISQFAKADCHLFVATDEMHPHLKPGDVLALKHVPLEAPIVNGEIYVVNSQYLGITIRQIYNRGDHLEMRSSCSRYETFDIPISQVYCVFRVLGLVRTNIQ